LTPFLKLLRTLFERMFGRWYEGEDPPMRFEKVVCEFAGFYPRATRGEWGEFALKFAQQAYREGYQRGMERSERVPGDALPELPPELAADLLDPTWRERPFEELGPVGIPASEEIPADPPDAEEKEWSSV
jgi:hypothetical protein